MLKDSLRTKIFENSTKSLNILGIEPKTRGLKVHCSTTELHIRTKGVKRTFYRNRTYNPQLRRLTLYPLS